jgi:P4 family phage/plasmid primase-like protien
MTLLNITLCPERTEYKNFINDPENRKSEDFNKVRKMLLEKYKLEFHNYFAEMYPYLRYEIGEEKVYWNYDEANGVYVEVAQVTVREWVIKLLIDEQLNSSATDAFSKTVMSRYRACYQERGSLYDDFDSDDEWFHARNGWVNLSTLVFEGHTPERLSRMKSAVDYSAEAVCPRYDEFLDKDLELRADQVRVIDQFSGLSLTNDIKYQKMLTLTGRTGCGKSTLMDAWNYVVGDMMIEKKLTELQGDSMRFAGVQFIGKRLCWFDEVDVKKAEMGNSLGTLITGQHINVERKGINGIVRAKNTLKCVLTANRLPLSAEIGIFRRLILIPIKVSFTETDREDNNIHVKLQAEASGILNRMIRGLQDLRKLDRFAVIAGHEDLIEEYKASADTIAEFLDEHFDVGTKDDMVPSKVLYNTYQRYTEGNSFTRSISPQKFGQLLASQPLTRFSHIEVKRTKTERLWTGLKVKSGYKMNVHTEVLESVEEGSF